jgi:ribosomal-protein-alanine N-acetyltransferase
VSWQRWEAFAPPNKLSAFSKRTSDHWEKHSYGLWVFRDQTDKRFVGRGGLRNVTLGAENEVEVAYAVMAEFWSKGVATEIATVSLKVAFERIGIGNIVAFTLPTNWASRRVMEKVGLRYERDIVHAGRPHVLYRIKGERHRMA